MLTGRWELVEVIRHRELPPMACMKREVGQQSRVDESNERFFQDHPYPSLCPVGLMPLNFHQAETGFLRAKLRASACFF